MRPSRAAGAILRYLLGVSATTLVASTATAPLAAFHFQTVPTYGVLANLVAVPLTSFVVMPAGMIGLLLMPLGLDGPAFQVMALGLRRRAVDARAPLRRCPAPRCWCTSGRWQRWPCGVGRPVARALAAALALLGLLPCAAALCSCCRAARPT